MNPPINFEFRWLSPLGISAGLFLGQGALTVFVAALVLLINHRIGAKRAGDAEGGILLSGRMDSSFLGKDLRFVTTFVTNSRRRRGRLD